MKICFCGESLKINLLQNIFSKTPAGKGKNKNIPVEPKIIILYVKETQEEKWLKSAVKGLTNVNN